MRMIFTPVDESEAAFVVSLLSAENISAQLWTARGETGQTTPQIWLHNDEDVPQASFIIQEYVKKLKEPIAEGEPWKCGGCGEEHLVTFSECWKCGRTRPEEKR